MLASVSKLNGILRRRRSKSLSIWRKKFTSEKNWDWKLTRLCPLLAAVGELLVKDKIKSRFHQTDSCDFMFWAPTISVRYESFTMIYSNRYIWNVIIHYLPLWFQRIRSVHETARHSGPELIQLANVPVFFLCRRWQKVNSSGHRLHGFVVAQLGKGGHGGRPELEHMSGFLHTGGGLSAFWAAALLASECKHNKSVPKLVQNI